MGRNRTVLFAMLVLAQFAQGAQGAQYSMITVGFPSIMDDLDTSLRWVGWVFSIFLIGHRGASQGD